MGLAGGIVRRVLSKSPCSSSSSAASSRNNERGPVDHRRRWGSLRLYLCGEEVSKVTATAAEDGEDNEDDDGTVSTGSFENRAMPQEPRIPVLEDRRRGIVNYGEDSSNPEECLDQIQGKHGVEDSVPMVSEEEAATLIQSAFRGFRARKRFSSGQQGCCTEEPRSPASASMAASVEVQVGESMSNLRLSDDTASLTAQHQASQKSRPQILRAKEEWNDSTVSSNVLRMRIQSRIEATTRRERALAYAFSQQLRSGGGGGGTKKRSSRSEQGEFNVGWSWLERWMATRQTEPSTDDCMSKNAVDSSSMSAAGRRVIVVRRWHVDVAVEEKESCGSNDVSAVSFDGSSTGGRSGLSFYRPSKNRLRGARNLPRRKVASSSSSSDHRLQEAKSHKVNKKARHREENQLKKDQTEADSYDPRQPPTDY